jgi:hypothetical protein
MPSAAGLPAGEPPEASRGVYYNEIRSAAGWTHAQIVGPSKYLWHAGGRDRLENDKMGNEDELRDTLNQAATEISERQSNPRAWQSWMVFLLTRLEDEATKAGSASKDSFLDMLSALQDSIRNRQRTGGW